MYLLSLAFCYASMQYGFMAIPHMEYKWICDWCTLQPYRINHWKFTIIDGLLIYGFLICQAICVVHSHGLNVKYGPYIAVLEQKMWYNLNCVFWNKTLKPFVPCCQHLKVRVALGASSCRPNWLSPSEPEAVLETVVE